MQVAQGQVYAVLDLVAQDFKVKENLDANYHPVKVSICKVVLEFGDHCVMEIFLNVGQQHKLMGHFGQITL